MTSAPPEAPTAPGSGAHDLIGYDIDLSAGDGTSRVVLDIAPKHLNRNGSLHGGVIAMMLDASGGFAASMASRQGLIPVVTVALNTQYLAPVMSGQVVAIGSVKQAGGSICYADAELRDATGNLIATGNGVFKYMRKGVRK